VKPLQSVAMGLLIVALGARVNGYDLLPDPLGWLLVLQGLHRLPAELPFRQAVRSLGVLALATSVVLWVPALADGLERTDESLLWAADLPQLAFVAMLLLALSRAAAELGDAGAARWLRTTSRLTVLAAVLPVLVYGARQDGLVVAMVLGATIVLVLVIVLLFRYSDRAWASAEPAVSDN